LSSSDVKGTGLGNSFSSNSCGLSSSFLSKIVVSSYILTGGSSIGFVIDSSKGSM